MLRSILSRQVRNETGRGLPDEKIGSISIRKGVRINDGMACRDYTPTLKRLEGMRGQQVGGRGAGERATICINRSSKRNLMEVDCINVRMY